MFPSFFLFLKVILRRVGGMSDSGERRILSPPLLLPHDPWGQYLIEKQNFPQMSALEKPALSRFLFLLASHRSVSRSFQFSQFILQNMGNSAYAAKCKINANCPEDEHVGFWVLQTNAFSLSPVIQSLLDIEI